jgi:F-type H+-transporting ATPase subunit b
LLFEAVNFLLLAGLLGWLLFRPLRQALASRHAALLQEREALSSQQAEVERAQTASRQRAAALEVELEERRQQALAVAHQEAERIRAEARTSADQERASVRSQLAHLETAQLEHLAAAVAAAAGAVVQRLLEQMGGPELERGLAQAAYRALHELARENLGAVMVESAHPLDQETQTAIRTVLGEAAPTATFRRTPTLGAGLRVSTSQGLVDTSATGLAAYAQRTLVTQLGLRLHEHADSPPPC